MDVKIAGEVRAVLRRADGSIKTDTGFQKNIILNQGLDFLGGAGPGSSMNDYCAIGGGNSAPLVTQTSLDAFIAVTGATGTTADYSYVDAGDNLYRHWEQKTYRFTGLGDVNISEVGLVSSGQHLTTRALIKDSLGAPTTISIKTGETLDIFYKLHRVTPTEDKTFTFNGSDGADGSVPYNVIVRPMMVGNYMYTYEGHFSSPIRTSSAGGYNDAKYNTAEIGAITAGELGGWSILTTEWGTYTPGSYKKRVTFKSGLNDNNFGIRSMSLPTTFGAWQLRFGRVSDDAPITKTSKDIMSMDLEFSWGRYEGAL